MGVQHGFIRQKLRPQSVILKAVAVFGLARVDDVALAPQFADASVHFRDEHHLLEVARADAVASLVVTDGRLSLLMPIVRHRGRH